MSVGQSQACCVQAVAGQTLHFEHVFSRVLTCFNFNVKLTKANNFHVAIC